MRLALALVLVSLCSFAAAPVHGQDRLAYAVRRPAPALHVYEGLYVQGRDTLRVQHHGDGLGVVVQGPSVLRLLPLLPTVPHLNAEAARLLEGWQRHDLAPTAAALDGAHRDERLRYVAGFLAAVARHCGPLQAVRVLGSYARPDGGAETLAELACGQRPPVLVRLGWDDAATPRLVRVARGPGAMALGASPLDTDRFRLAGAVVAFRRGQEDGITGLTLRDASGTLPFRRVQHHTAR